MNNKSQIIAYNPNVNLTEKKASLNNNVQEVITVNDILSAPKYFKENSVGEKVSFIKVSGSNPESNKDVIIPGELEITRGNSGGGIYNIAVQGSYNNSAPANTFWATKFNNPTFDSWAPLWDLTTRTYDTWKNAVEVPEGNNMPPQYVGMPSIMQYNDRYWLIQFTEWGVGAYDEYGFAYDRWEIFPSVEYTRDDYDDNTVDIISEGVHIARKSNGGQIYNAIDEPHAEWGVSPRNTRWNSIYTDSRTNYSGYNDLSNLESRVYTDFAAALDGYVGNHVLDTDLIMHDLTTDLYYKINFSSWTSGGNGGGFTYTRTVIPQSQGVKFADGTVLNTKPTSIGGDSCCSIDANLNYIAADNSNNEVSVDANESHLIGNFSGMLLVNDHYDGGVELWIAGGGDAVMVSHTDATPGNNTLTMNGGGYEWTNVDGLTGPFTFTVIKTRQGS